VGLLLCSRARRVNLLGKVVTTYHSDEQEISCTRPLVDFFFLQKKSSRREMAHAAKWPTHVSLRPSRFMEATAHMFWGAMAH
jgi:hypothetical protein